MQEAPCIVKITEIEYVFLNIYNRDPFCKSGHIHYVSEVSWNYISMYVLTYIVKQRHISHFLNDTWNYYPYI